MPRYYFDIHDGETFTQDLGGLELEDVAAAQAEAQRALAEVAKDKLPDKNRRDFTATVRDEAGQTVLRITLLLRVESAPVAPRSVHSGSTAF
jgi:hypothetical protein